MLEKSKARREERDKMLEMKAQEKKRIQDEKRVREKRVLKSSDSRIYVYTMIGIIPGRTNDTSFRLSED